jgi:hypothetical protein
VRVLLLIIGFLSLHLTVLNVIDTHIAFKDSFPYREFLNYYEPPILRHLANFDGAQYITIARDGYREFQQGYFPLFPYLISYVSHLFAYNHLTTGLLISWVSFAGGIFLLHNYLKILTQRDPTTNWTIAFLFAFPASFFYVALYPESLFFFLMIGGLYTVATKKYYWAVLFGTLASLCKVQGVLLLLPYAVMILSTTLLAKKRSLPTLTPPQLLAIFSPLYGVVIYMFYLYSTYGDPFFFYHAQSAFGANRSATEIILFPQVIYRYIKIFLTAQINFQYMIAVVEFGSFAVIAGGLIFHLWLTIRKGARSIDPNHLALNLFSWANLFLPTLTGTFTSLPRYALISLAAFVGFARIPNTNLKLILYTTFVVLHFVLYMYFLRGYFVS